MVSRILHKSTGYSISELTKFIEQGHIGVPDFQRDFVWEPSQVVELFDSVSRGWPVGSMLVLEGPQPFDLKQIDGGPETSRESARLYLLDGQQRATSLYHILRDAGKTVYYVNLDKISADPGEASKDIKWLRRDQYEKRTDASRLLKISTLADEAEFLEATKYMSSNDYALAKRVRHEVLGVLVDSDYILPAILLENGIDLEALTRIFETLNRTGVKLDAFDLMVAIMRRSDFKLRQRWDDALASSERMRRMETEGIEILKLIALWERSDFSISTVPKSRRVDGVRQRDVLNIPAQTVIDRFDEAVKAYESALVYLELETGIGSGKEIPSLAMILPLAFFLHAELSRTLIDAWYWRAIATQAYAQGANTRVVSDVDSITRGNTKSEPEDTSRKSALDKLRAALSDSTARNRILRLALRGISLLEQEQDALDGGALSPPLTEVSLPAGLDGRIAAPKEETLSLLAITSAKAISQQRRSLRKSNNKFEFDPTGIRSQHFLGEHEPAVQNPEIAATNRSAHLVKWFEARL